MKIWAKLSDCNRRSIRIVIEQAFGTLIKESIVFAPWRTGRRSTTGGLYLKSVLIGLIHHETGLATLLDILLGDARVKKHLLVLVIKLRKKSLPRSRKMETVITKFNTK